ncbi:MAG: hypothetical protein ACOX62_10680 [Christensenellales bacterium]|jgi:hypothetical protein
MCSPTMKKRLICDLSMITKIEKLKDNELILLTPAGVVTGYPADTDNLGIVAQLAQTVSYKHREKLEMPDDMVLPGNDGYIALRNVQLRTGGTTYEFEELLVFFDQIIGITFKKRHLTDYYVHPPSPHPDRLGFSAPGRSF